MYKERHQVDKSVQAVFSTVQQLQNDRGHLSLTPPKCRLHQLVEDEPVILPWLGNTGTWFNCKHTEAMLWSRTQRVTWNSADHSFKTLKKADSFLTDPYA